MCQVYGICVFSMLSLCCILISDLVVTNLFMHSLPGMILLYLTAPFLHRRVFLHEIIITFVRVMHCYRSRIFHSEFFTHAKLIRRYVSQCISFTDNTTCSVILIQSRKSSKYACYINSTSFGK